jgi:hypothetical protein
LLNCSNEYFNFTSNRFSGIKVSSRLPLFPVLYRRRFTVVEETNKLVSGPWIGQKTLSPFHCPCTSIPIYFQSFFWHQGQLKGFRSFQFYIGVASQSSRKRISSSAVPGLGKRLCLLSTVRAPASQFISSCTSVVACQRILGFWQINLPLFHCSSTCI